MASHERTAAALKAIADWQIHPMARLAEKAKDCTGPLHRGGVLAGKMVDAIEEISETVKPATKSG